MLYEICIMSTLQNKSVSRDEIVALANQWLQPALFNDYCPNGLQIEGNTDVYRIVSGVTASLALIEEAIERKADILLVHHGYFWRGEDSRIIGMKRRRVEKLLQNGINLLAYHLPLDAHPEMGNNAQLAIRLGLRISGGLDPNSPRPIGNIGEVINGEISLEQFAKSIETALQRKPLVIAGGNHQIKRVGWCTGGAQSYIEQALMCGMDAYLTGEVSEQTVHFARENGIHFIAAGHHATERYGVQALGESLAQHFGISHEFVDCPNPV
jgi:dinuclear metal center YbgI/SA1388 family protein